MPWFEPSSSAPRYHHHRHSSAASQYNDDGDENEWGGANNTHQNQNALTNSNEDFNNEISLHNYLDLNWTVDNGGNHDDGGFTHNNSSGNGHHSDRRGVNFDALHHRVEQHLGLATILFPSGGLVSNSNNGALNPTLYHGSNNNIYGGITHFNAVQRDSSYSNGEEIGGGDVSKKIMISKTAQFFHPWRVMALEQYDGFFSPMDANAIVNNNSNIAIDDCAGQEIIGNVQNYSQNEEIMRSMEGNKKLPEPRNLFHQQQQTATTTAAAATHNSHHHHDKIQSTLHQDPKTKRLMMTTHDLVSKGAGGNSISSHNNRLSSSWENYGGRRPIVDNRNDDGGSSSQQKEGSLQNKSKKKTKKKDKKGAKNGNNNSGNEQRIDIMFQQKSSGRDENDDNRGEEEEDNIAKKEKRSKKKKKKRPLLPNNNNIHDDSLFGELNVPTSNQGVDNNMSSSPSSSSSLSLSEQDFEGMTNILNAAQCMEGLQQFLSRVGEETYVAWTMIFLDPICHYSTQHHSFAGNNNGGGGGGGGGGGNKRRKRSKKFAFNSTTASSLECTTPFLPSNKRYCTDKGPSCTAWNCTCDDQIRAMRGSAPLLGAMFVLNKDNSGCESSVTGGEKDCYLLPLGPTENCLDGLDEAGYSRMKSWPVIPFDCEVSLSDRWSAFEAIISNKDMSRKMVTYNATTALMPFYYHQFHDECSSMSATTDGQSQVSQIETMLSSSQFTACLTGASQDDNQYNSFQRPANLRSIWDLRLVSWMLRPDVNDDQLEWSTFKSGFPHLVPSGSTLVVPCDDMPIISRGLMDTRADLALLHSLYPLINEQLIRKDLLRSLENIETPVQSILTSMECRGVGFYPQRLKRVESQLSARIDELGARGRAVTRDSDFLLSSPQQVSQYLFDKLQLKVPDGIVSKTKSSHRSTSEEALKAIKSDVMARTGSAPEILDIILEFRTLNKLLTTYIRPLPLLCVRAKGKSKKTPSRIHPQWMMTAVRTGRLSCRKPNLQQLPSDAVFGVKPRDAIVPSAREGMCVFACDYSQKEVRILAHMSGDEVLISLFRGDSNTDIYKQMASVIRNRPAESITPEERAQFKQVTLALLYGMSPNQVAKKLSISKAAAQQTMNDFFRRFRRVKSWMEEIKQGARRNGYVLTIAGRRRYLNDIRSKDNDKRSQAERQAINTVIQGSAADLMKTAMIQLSENLQSSWQEEGVGAVVGELSASASEAVRSPRPQMVLQIHDEVLLELQFKEEDIKQLQAIALKSCCRDCEELFNLKVPLLVKCSCGLSFGSMKEI